MKNISWVIILVVALWAIPSNAGIVKSVIQEDATQANGTRHVRECHTDHLGVGHVYSYTAAKTADVNKIMADRVTHIEAMLAEAELEAVVEKVMRGKTYKLGFTTPAQLDVIMIRKKAEKEAEITALTIEKDNLGTEISK